METHHERLGIAQALLALVVILLIPGCVVLPSGKGTVLEGEAMDEEQLEFLDDPATLDTDVVERLGQPDLVWYDERVFAYHWEIRDGVAIWAIPLVGGYGAAVGSSELSSKYVLLVQFDELGHVLRHESRNRPSSKAYGKMIKEWVAEGAGASP